LVSSLYRARVADAAEREARLAMRLIAPCTLQW
jgi:hypothetical protein